MVVVDDNHKKETPLTPQLRRDNESQLNQGAKIHVNRIDLVNDAKDDVDECGHI